METKSVSLKNIIGRIKRHPMLSDIPMETIIDYAVDFFKIVGLPTAYTDRTTVLHIEKFRSPLPDDFIEMTQVRTLGPDPKYYRYTTDSFHLSINKVDAAPFTYKLQGHFIYVTEPFTKIEISYKAIDTDECGLPLIPDNAKFIRALERYIKVQHFEILYDQGKINDKVYERAQQEYCWAVGACETEFNSLSVDKLESVLNMAKSLLIRDMEHHRGYATAGSKEFIKVK